MVSAKAIPGKLARSGREPRVRLLVGIVGFATIFGLAVIAQGCASQRPPIGTAEEYAAYGSNAYTPQPYDPYDPFWYGMPYPLWYPVPYYYVYQGRRIPDHLRRPEPPAPVARPKPAPRPPRAARPRAVIPKPAVRPMEPRRTGRDARDIHHGSAAEPGPRLLR